MKRRRLFVNGAPALYSPPRANNFLDLFALGFSRFFPCPTVILPTRKNVEEPPPALNLGPRLQRLA
jgi:hypothetical protein